MRAQKAVRALADYAEDFLITAKRLWRKRSLALAATAVAAYTAFVAASIFISTRPPDLTDRSTASSLRAFDGSAHPFVFPVSGASAKTFPRPEDADDVVRRPCERLTAHEVSSNLYEPAGGGGGTKYIVSNLFDVGERVIAGREHAIALPKLYNTSAAPCAAPPEREGHAHEALPPNPCIMTLLSDTGEVVYAVNPSFRPAGRRGKASVLIADDTFPEMPPRWCSYYERIVFTFKDWQTMNRVEEELWGVRSYTVQAAVHLLLYGRTIYDPLPESNTLHQHENL